MSVAALDRAAVSGVRGSQGGYGEQTRSDLGWRIEVTHALDDMRWEDHDPGTDDRALVKIDSVLIDQPEAPG